jgi:hypothetical protein
MYKEKIKQSNRVDLLPKTGESADEFISGIQPKSTQKEIDIMSVNFPQTRYYRQPETEMQVILAMTRLYNIETTEMSFTRLYNSFEVDENEMTLSPSIFQHYSHFEFPEMTLGNPIQQLYSTSSPLNNLEMTPGQPEFQDMEMSVIQPLYQLYSAEFLEMTLDKPIEQLYSSPGSSIELEMTLVQPIFESYTVSNDYQEIEMSLPQPLYQFYTTPTSSQFLQMTLNNPVMQLYSTPSPVIELEMTVLQPLYQKYSTVLNDVHESEKTMDQPLMQSYTIGYLKTIRSTNLFVHTNPTTFKMMTESETQIPTALQQETSPCSLDEIPWISTTTPYLQSLSTFTTPCYLDQLSSYIPTTTPCYLDESTLQAITPHSPPILSSTHDSHIITKTELSPSSTHTSSILFEIIPSKNKRIVVISVSKNKKKLTLIRSSLNQTSLVVVQFLENPQVYVRNFNSTYPIHCIKRMLPKTFITLQSSTKPNINVVSNPSMSWFLVQTECKFGATSTLFRQSKILTVLFLPVEMERNDDANWSYFFMKETLQSKRIDEKDDIIVALSNSIPDDVFSIECS